VFRSIYVVGVVNTFKTENKDTAMSKPLVLPVEVEDKAIELRKSGKSYKVILEELLEYGATDWWVKRVCKGVVMEETAIDKAATQVCELAIRSCGVKPSEIIEVYYSIFGTVFDDTTQKHELALSQKDKNTIKRKATALGKKRGERVLYVPEWVDVHNCEVSKQTLFSAAETLHYCLMEIEKMYVDRFPTATAWEISSFMYEVAACNITALSPQGISARFDSVVEKLHTIEDCVEQDGQE